MRILLIARDPAVLSSLKPLVPWGHRITVCQNLAGADSHAAKKSTDLVLADMQDAELDFVEWCRGKELPFAVLTDQTGPEGTVDQLPRLPDKERLQKFVNKVAPQVDAIPLQHEQAMVICDDDEELLREIIEVFLGDAPNHIEGMRQGLKAGNLENVRRAAHAIKGASGNIAAESLREAAQHLERAAKDGNPNTARAAFSQVQYELHRLKKFLNREMGLD